MIYYLKFIQIIHITEIIVKFSLQIESVNSILKGDKK